MRPIKHPVDAHIKSGHPQSGSSMDITKQKLGDAHRVQRTDELQMNVPRDFWVEDSGLRGWSYGEEWRQQGGVRMEVTGVMSLERIFRPWLPLFCFPATMRRAALIHHLDKKGDKVIMAP